MRRWISGQVVEVLVDDRFVDEPPPMLGGLGYARESCPDAGESAGATDTEITGTDLLSSSMATM